MLTLFTAIGHLTIQKNDKGTRIPIVKTGGQEYALSTHELYLWSSLAFQILTKEELQQIYHTQAKEHLRPNDSDFTYVLRRLLTRGIIVQGGGVTGVDALYRLFAQMHIVPVKASPFMRFSSCVRAWLHGHLPLTMLPRYLKKPTCTPLEALILKLAEELSFPLRNCWDIWNILQNFPPRQHWML